MGSRLRLSIKPRARADMLEIWTYIAVDSERAAEKMLRRIGDTLEILALQPGLGRRRAELGQSLRSFRVGNYVVFYELHET